MISPRSPTTGACTNPAAGSKPVAQITVATAGLLLGSWAGSTSSHGPEHRI
jgi:hypothetical protein